MKVLCVDTSSSAGSVVLTEDSKILGEVNLDSSLTHTSRLLTSIQHILNHVGLTLNSIDAFSVICGPGSFTGVRIGLATVKALAEVLSKPILAVTTFEARAEKAPRWQGALVPLIDARRNEVYARVFERNGNCLIQRKPDWVGKPEKFLQTLDSKSILFLGDGAEKYDELIRAEGPSSWEIAKTDFYLGRSLVSIVNSKEYSQIWSQPEEIFPYFLRKSDAELKWSG